MVYKVAFLLFCVAYLAGADEGDPCTKDGAPGTCININKCPSVAEDLKKKKFPQICSFIGSDPVVCCVSKNAPPTPAPTPRPPAPTPRPPTPKPTKRPPVTTKTPPPIIDDFADESDTCEPLSSKLTADKTGQKAWDKCIEYQQDLVYPCKRALSIVGGGASRRLNCHHNADDLIVGGEDAAQYEFPHMVMLGYGQESDIQWLCGGSLVSDRWVLTAGHCVTNRNFGQVNFVRVGVLRRSEPAGDSVRRVTRREPAPGYESANRYNDIALVMMDRPVKLTEFIVPACINTGDVTALHGVAENRVLATGWGLTEHRGNVSDTLQKVILQQFTSNECSDAFPAGDRHMLWGVDDSSQICFGDKEKEKDTCQGDSGGPIMIKSRKIHCMYVVTGVTSFGKRCGRIGSPAIYTRTSNFVSWIESVVWP